MKRSKSLEYMINIAERLNKGERVAVTSASMAVSVINWYAKHGTKINHELSSDGLATVLWK
jgi:hypothetical protein